MLITCRLGSACFLTNQRSGSACIPHWWFFLIPGGKQHKGGRVFSDSDSLYLTWNRVSQESPTHDLYRQPPHWGHSSSRTVLLVLRVTHSRA